VKALQWLKGIDTTGRIILGTFTALGITSVVLGVIAVSTTLILCGVFSIMLGMLIVSLGQR